ncbi:alpha/beta fold hydrolase [Streptomyces sp. RG80]|uniref:thioesterase II family protein n=1 Tax=Streptomyces sp. RG80 TaxID=3157340 RepID=UPI00338F74E5
MKPADQQWTVQRSGDRPAAVRLFLLPYAGGSSSAFSSWPELLDPGIEACPVVLPGRERRIAEPPVPRMSQLVPPLIEGLVPHLRPPFAFFGHSMGALIAFETTRRLLLHGLPAPEHLFLSAACPTRSRHRNDRHRLGDEELVTELRELSGTPPEFFDAPELVALLLPTIRADFELAETYEVPEGTRLPVPITVFAGERDPSFPPSEAKAWQRHTTGSFAHHVLPGDHFFLNDQVRPMAGTIGQTLLTRP